MVEVVVPYQPVSKQLRETDYLNYLPRLVCNDDLAYISKCILKQSKLATNEQLTKIR